MAAGEPVEYEACVTAVSMDTPCASIARFAQLLYGSFNCFSGGRRSIGVGLFVCFTRTSDLKCGLQENHTVIAVVPVQYLL